MEKDYPEDVDFTTLEPEERTKHLGSVEVDDKDRVGKYHGELSLTKVTNEMLKNDATNPNSWLQYNGNLEQTGYTPADRITTDNVDGLKKEYEIKTESLGMETDPVVVPGDPPEMYFTQHKGLVGAAAKQKPENQIKVHAVNARTGEKIWTFNYKFPQGVFKGSEAIGVNRGVTVYGDKVYLGTLDTKIVAINRNSGKQAWATSVLLDDQEQDRTSLTAAPVAYDGKILFGQAGDAAGWSVIGAVDANSGDVLWTKKTHKEDGWVGETWKFSSASSWMSPAVDPDSNTVFYSIANPDPMMNGVVRPGPNMYSDSVMALDADTGEMKWNNQFAPHELWDYDCHCGPLVFDMKVDGETRRVVTQDWKPGWSYVLDAETGQLLQRSEPFARQGGDGFFTPPPAGKENATTMAPTPTGGTEWPPDAYSPKTGFRYIGANNNSTKVWYDPSWAWGPDNYNASGGGFKGLKGGNSVDVVAQNPATGQTQWTYSVPDVDPDWIDQLLFTGGTTATGGNVVFHGSSGGHVYALDDSSGEELWNADAGGRITASPVVWDDPKAGKQFVAVTASNTIVTYAGK